MSAALYRCGLVHVRRTPLRRAFAFRLHLWLVDLDELPPLPRWLRPFARILPSDHLGEPGRSLRQNVDALLRSRGVEQGVGRVLMLTSARTLGHVFNPLTLYWCLSPTGEVVQVIAEVSNTYGQRHCYLLRPSPSGRARVAKEFYVSPFLSVSGEYRMGVPLPGERLMITVALVQDGRTVFTAVLRGRRETATPAAVLRAALGRPFQPQRVSLAIRRHGLALWARRLQIFPRPQAERRSP